MNTRKQTSFKAKNVNKFLTKPQNNCIQYIKNKKRNSTYQRNNKKAQSELSFKLITNAVAHFQTVSYSLQHGIYFLTLHINNISNVRNITDVIYLKITKALAEVAGITNFWHSSHRPGIILCGDVEGTRIGKIQNKHLYPHIHAVIILPKSIIKNISSNRIIEIIKTAASKINEAKQPFVEHHVPQTDRQDPVHIVNYVIKAHFQTTIGTHNSDCFCPQVYPYGLDIKKSKAKKIRIQKEAEKKQPLVRLILDYMIFCAAKMEKNIVAPKEINSKKLISKNYPPGQARGELWQTVNAQYLGRHRKAI